ncbi:MAG: hypothetical protein FWC32_01990 [Firmicutes bacterium]|nr:hypothetical protein [Bacillota bacterium]
MKMFLLLLCLFLLSGCMTDSPVNITGTPRSRSFERPPAEGAVYSIDEDKPAPVAVLYAVENAAPGLYEPADGIYLAAWLAPHTLIRNFIHHVDKNHAVFVHELSLGQEVPVNWILQCISVLATPLIVVHPPQDDNCEVPVGDKISYLAQKLGAFNLPMFIAFYPPGHGLTAREYSVMFRYARALFLHHAPQAAFVWVAPGAEATVQDPFFPGHDAVDWVGVSLFARRNSGGLEDVVEQFTPFYHRFQAYHPIMVLPLGVSHFSRLDHTYRLQEAAAEITRVYRALAGFPRVGLVAYADAFGLTPATNDEFAISIERELISVYAKAVANAHFLSALERDTTHGPRRVRCKYMGYYHNSRVYVSAETLSRLAIPVPRFTTEVNGRVFIDIDRVAGASFCEKRNVILIDYK